MDTSETVENASTPTPEPTGVVLLFCTDLMFGVELQSMSRKAGLRPVTLRPGIALPEGNILVVDLRARGDWETMIRAAVARNMPVVAFGPHVDAEGRQKAKAAGASRVLSNSNLARDLPIILKEI
jgi:hypothetical protein